jgi:hypothetical protein
MNPSHPATEAWSEWWKRLDSLIRHLRRGRGAIVNSTSLRAEAKEAVQHYFRQVRPHLLQLNIGDAKIDQFDWITQYIVRLTSRGNRKSTYLRRLRELTDLRGDVEGDIEIRSASAVQPATRLTTATESAIMTTSDQVLPSSSLSYKQVLQDLGDQQRVSYRGTAAELREVLRELLDHLAPDEEVLKTTKLEKDQKHPTMKQKTMFILKARGVGDTVRKPAEDAVAAVEDSVGSLARSVYNRGSLSTHIATTRREVLTFKGYADAVLADLLQIHK